MEEDICFTVMLSLVSRDPFFQIWRSRCWESCAGAVFCPFVRFKGWEWAAIHTILNHNTLETIFQLSRVGFEKFLPWKQGKNLLNCLKSLQLALRAVICGWIQITLHKSLVWSKVVIVWHSGCCFPSKCRARLKDKAKILLMILKASLQFLASTFGYCIKLLIFKWTNESFREFSFQLLTKSVTRFSTESRRWPGPNSVPPLILKKCNSILSSWN